MSMVHSQSDDFNRWHNLTWISGAWKWHDGRRSGLSGRSHRHTHATFTQKPRVHVSFQNPESVVSQTMLFLLPKPKQDLSGEYQTLCVGSVGIYFWMCHERSWRRFHDLPAGRRRDRFFFCCFDGADSSFFQSFSSKWIWWNTLW